MEEKELKGFYGEQKLAEMVYKGEITRLQYVWHNTEQMRLDFINFCSRKGLEKNEAAAMLFMESLLTEEEELHRECNG